MPCQKTSGHDSSSETGSRADAERGRKLSATQPTIGAPIGVPPSAMLTRSAITLPRMAGSVESCIRLFVVFAKVRADAPMMTSAPAKNQ
jgi:hypothetical protein